MGVVDNVKERLEVAEYIGRHVPLEKSGRTLKGLCPFHTEKTPSFFVFPDNQRWHCFGCGKGGDIFNFVMEFERLDFRAALEELARQAGIELHPRTPEQAQADSEAERLRNLLTETAAYYQHLLRTAPQATAAREYLQSRGFTAETSATFQLGYSLDSWDALRTYLFGKGYAVEEQLKAGMLVEKEQGGTYDRFRDRLMIPIHDRRGQVIAFGARGLAPDAKPKYLNSPQTALFDKGAVLYGYHLASGPIRDADAAVIVEGYMDVMIPYQAGYRNIVAPMGTALSEAHLKQLQRLTRNFILALDPDAAGVHATLRGLEVARETLDRDWEPVFDPRGLVGYEGRLQADIRVVTLPDGLDPDELILADPRKWESLLTGAQPVVRFFFEQLLLQENPREPKGKARIVDAMLPLLNDIADSVEREAYAQEIALRLGLDARMLLDRLRVRERAQAVRQQSAVKRPAAATPLAADREAYVLTVLMRNPELLELLDRHLAAEELPPLAAEDFTAAYAAIWEAWLDMGQDPTVEMEDLLPPDLLEQVNAWVSAPLPEMTPEQWERDVHRVVLRLRELQLRAIKQGLDGLISEAQQEGDIKGESYAALIHELSQDLRRIQQALAR